MSFNGRIDPGPSVQERIEVYNRHRLRELAGEPEDVVEWENFDKVSDKFDKVSVSPLSAVKILFPLSF